MDALLHLRKKISAQAPSCPHCGHDYDERYFRLKFFGSIIIYLVFFTWVSRYVWPTVYTGSRTTDNALDRWAFNLGIYDYRMTFSEWLVMWSMFGVAIIGIYSFLWRFSRPDRCDFTEHIKEPAAFVLGCGVISFVAYYAF